MKTNEGERSDRALLEELKLEELGIKAKECDFCKAGSYVFQRVINAAGCPYSIVVCKRCGFERYSMETARESRLIAHAKEQLHTT